MSRKMLTIPRFPEMTLRDAIALGTRRLEEDGYLEVRFDPASVVRTIGPDAEEGDWRLGFLVVEPEIGAAPGEPGRLPEGRLFRRSATG